MGRILQLQPHNLYKNHLFFFHTVCFLVVATISLRADAALLQGCKFDEDLCDEGEICVPDGLFGQCYSDSESETVKPLVLDRPLNGLEKELMRLELTRLASDGYNWPHAQAQCILAYFKLTIVYELDYDTDFCNVRNPQNIWELIQRIQTLLITEEEEAESRLAELIAGPGDGEYPPEATNEQEAAADAVVPVVLLDEGQTGGDEPTTGGVELYEVVNPEVLDNAEGPILIEVDDPKEEGAEEGTADKKADPSEDGAVPNRELEEAIPVISVDKEQQQQMLKKDAERFTSVDMGLANTVHKIVKGGIQRVEGNRVYMKVAKDNMTEDELLKVIDYLDRSVADPNSLYFDEFLYEEGQLSFRVSRVDLPQRRIESPKDKKSVKLIDNASGVASAVYKRRKDIQTLAGVEVDETGIGSGADVVPVERSDRDALFVPILAICALTITSLLSVLAVHVYKNRRSHGRFNKSYLPEVIDHVEGKPSAVYEELCRQRMNNQDAPIAVKIGGGRKTSKQSSTSSWPDESLLQSSNLDISTGHVLLEWCREHLDKPGEISTQWKSLADYVNGSGQLSSANEEVNKEKNFDWSVLPYNDSAVTLQAPSSSGDGSHYVNASKIYDSDPQQVVYIAAQSPIQNTAVDFWQMVWEQGVALMVNLANSGDYKRHERLVKYWPEENSKVYGNYEIHLVSEHIWHEDYVVRSFYLKNLSTGETRTVTQFHYLSWPEDATPSSTKSLLEFRRKINKSYRGRASPILVHCTNGAGRTGTFCLLDMVSNRILKGVKELDIAASLEHLRDQRMGIVENEEQYKFVFGCVAEEVNALLASLKG